MVETVPEDLREAWKRFKEEEEEDEEPKKPKPGGVSVRLNIGDWILFRTGALKESGRGIIVGMDNRKGTITVYFPDIQLPRLRLRRLAIKNLWDVVSKIKNVRVSREIRIEIDMLISLEEEARGLKDRLAQKVTEAKGYYQDALAEIGKAGVPRDEDEVKRLKDYLKKRISDIERVLDEITNLSAIDDIDGYIELVKGLIRLLRQKQRRLLISRGAEDDKIAPPGPAMADKDKDVLERIYEIRNITTWANKTTARANKTTERIWRYLRILEASQDIDINRACRFLEMVIRNCPDEPIRAYAERIYKDLKTRIGRADETIDRDSAIYSEGRNQRASNDLVRCILEDGPLPRPYIKVVTRNGDIILIQSKRSKSMSNFRTSILYRNCTFSH